MPRARVHGPEGRSVRPRPTDRGAAAGGGAAPRSPRFALLPGRLAPGPRPRDLVRSARRAGTLLAALAVLLEGPAARADVWVVDGSVRLDPVSGTLHEQRHPGPDGVDASYRDHNPVWSAEDRTVRLFAARNEVVAFQVVVGDGPHREVSVELSDLSGPATLAAADHVRRYREWFFQVSRESQFCDGTHMVTSLGTGWYPDPLVPIEAGPAAGFGQPFDIPCSRNVVPGQTAAAIWVDVLVPAGTPAGLYRGRVTVTLNGTSQELPLELEVRPITLPAENHAGLGTVNYGGLGFGVWDGPAGRQGLVPWFQIAHAHRLELDAMWMWPPWVAGVSVDWEEWRAAWRPFMTGSAFTRGAGYFGPSEGQPIRRFVLPHESNWPVSHYGWDDPRPTDEAFWQQALRDCEAILIEEGWTEVEAHLFVNGVDEPRDLETYRRIQYYGDLLDGAGLVDRANVRFRLDSGNFKNVGELVAGWDVQRIFAEIGDDVDVWNHNAGPRYVDALATQQRVRDNPDELWWFYTTCSAGEPAVGAPFIEGEALGMRTWGWIVFKYDMDGAVTWEMDGMRNDIDALRCWTDPACAGWGINGDAVLFYLGEHVGLPGQPVASIRVKNMRRGAQDHEYLWLLAQADGSRARAEGIAARLVPRALDDGLPHDGSCGRWSHDPSAYEDARREIAGLLPPDPERPDGGPDAGPDGGADGGPDGAADGGASPADARGCDCRAAPGARSPAGLLFVATLGALAALRGR